VKINVSPVLFSGKHGTGSIVSNSIARNCFTEVMNECLCSDRSIISINLNHVQPTINTFLPQWNFQKPNGLNSVEFVNKSYFPLTSIVFMSANYNQLSKLPCLRSHMPQYQTQPFYKISVPWWNIDCTVAVKNKKHALNHARLRSLLDILLLTLWHPAGFGDFPQKKHLNAHGFADEYLRSCSL